VKNKSCLREKELWEKIKGGKLDAAVEAHIRECPICRETALITAWINLFPAEKAQQVLAEKRLPEPDFLRSTAVEKKETDIKYIKKALRPILAVQTLTLFGLVGGIGLLLFFLFAGRGLFAGSMLRKSLLDGIGIFVAANPLAVATFVVFSVSLLISELKLIRS